MAQIKKLKENGNTIYPATIPQAVIDPYNNVNVGDLLYTIADAIAYGKNVKEAFIALQNVFGDNNPYGDEFGKDLVSAMTTIREFLFAADASDSTINRWKEIESFLAGIDDDETLLSRLQQIPAISSTITNINDNTFKQPGLYLAPISSITLDSGSQTLSGKQIILTVGAESGTAIYNQFIFINSQGGIGGLFYRQIDPIGQAGNFKEFGKYSNATQSSDGLMSATDKKNLDKLYTEVGDIKADMVTMDDQDIQEDPAINLGIMIQNGANTKKIKNSGVSINDFLRKDDASKTYLTSVDTSDKTSYAEILE